MFNAFIKSVKILIKDRQLIFWILLFPIVLSTLFFVAFSKLSSQDDFMKAKVVIVYEQGKDTAEAQAFAGAVEAAGQTLFEVSEAELSGALALLERDEADAVITVSGTVTLRIRKNDFQQTIVKSFLDEYNSMAAAVKSIIAENMAAGTVPDLNGIYTDLAGTAENFAANAAKGRNTDTTVIYYYALLGLTCFYFAMGGVNVIKLTQPNQSEYGKRASLSPLPRSKLFLATLLAHIAVFACIFAIIMCFLAFVLQVDFGAKVGFILLSCLLGMLTGIGFGMALGAALRYGDGVKIAVTVSVTMIFSVLAGLMSPELKYSVNRVVPWLRFINPVALISDCFYSLYYYQSLSQFGLYAGVLCGYIVVFYVVTVLLIRRKKYASV